MHPGFNILVGTRFTPPPGPTPNGGYEWNDGTPIPPTLYDLSATPYNLDPDPNRYAALKHPFRSDGQFKFGVHNDDRKLAFLCQFAKP